MEKKLLIVKEMSKYLGIGETTARKWLAEPAYSFVFRKEGRIFANNSLLDKYIDTCSGR